MVEVNGGGRHSDNSARDGIPRVGGIDGTKLRSLLARYERLQGEIDSLNGDKADLIKEVESTGFDKKVFRIVVKRRRRGKDRCDEEDTMVALYEQALEEPGEEAPEEDASRVHAREDVAAD
jgi:uncharacterized protein (UPF0335 family)